MSIVRVIFWLRLATLIGLCLPALDLAWRWYSDDLGETLIRMNSRMGMYSGNHIWAFANDPSDPNILLAGTNGGLFSPDRATRLSAALDGSAAARHGWQTYPPSLQRGLIWWVMSAKRPQTRERRIATIVGLAVDGRRPDF